MLSKSCLFLSLFLFSVSVSYAHDWISHPTPRVAGPESNTGICSDISGNVTKIFAGSNEGVWWGVMTHSGGMVQVKIVPLEHVSNPDAYETVAVTLYDNKAVGVDFPTVPGFYVLLWQWMSFQSCADIEILPSSTTEIYTESSSTAETTWYTESESTPYTTSWYTEQTTSSPQGSIGGFGIMVRPNGGSFIMPLMPIGAGSVIRFTAEWLVGADNIDFHVAIPVQIPGTVLYQLSIRSGWINGVFHNEIAQNSKNIYNQWEYEVVSNPIVIAQGQPFIVNIVFLSNYHVQTIIEHTNAKTTYSPFYLRTTVVPDQENYLEFGANIASTATVVISNIQFIGSSSQPSYSNAFSSTSW